MGMEAKAPETWFFGAVLFFAQASFLDFDVWRRGWPDGECASLSEKKSKKWRVLLD